MTRNNWATVCGQYLSDRGIKNFSALEICDVGRESGNATLSAPSLELLENAYKLVVNSWYRDRAYNAAIGGVASSMHLTLGAADVVKIGRTPSEVADLLESHPHSKLFGLGRYKTFTHIDVRGMIGRPSPARWGSNE